MYLQKGKWTIQVKFKLKKKWRFWRAFKKQFLRRKRKLFFLRFQFFYNMRRILWYQMSYIYGKKIKRLAYRKSQTSYLFGVRFFSVLNLLEMRLDVFTVRIGLFFTIQQAAVWIKKNRVGVNMRSKGIYYLVRIGDLVGILYTVYNIQRTASVACSRNFIKKRIFSFHNKWHRVKWRKFGWKLRKRKHTVANILSRRYTRPTRYISIGKNLCINFIEMNYKLEAGVLLRYPKWGEILLNSSKRKTPTYWLRRFYAVY